MIGDQLIEQASGALGGFRQGLAGGGVQIRCGESENEMGAGVESDAGLAGEFGELRPDSLEAAVFEQEFDARHRCGRAGFGIGKIQRGTKLRQGAVPDDDINGTGCGGGIAGANNRGRWALGGGPDGIVARDEGGSSERRRGRGCLGGRERGSRADDQPKAGQ